MICRIKGCGNEPTKTSDKCLECQEHDQKLSRWTEKTTEELNRQDIRDLVEALTQEREYAREGINQ